MANIIFFKDCTKGKYLDDEFFAKIIEKQAAWKLEWEKPEWCNTNSLKCI